MANLKKRLSFAQCVAAYDFLSTAYGLVGSLPTDKPASYYKEATAQELFDALETLTCDKAYLEKLPEIWMPNQKKIEEAEKSLREISKLGTSMAFDGSQLKEATENDLEGVLEDFKNRMHTKENFLKSVNDLLAEVTSRGYKKSR